MHVMQGKVNSCSTKSMYLRAGTIKHWQGTYANAVWFLAFLSFMLIFLVYTFPDPGRPTSAGKVRARSQSREHGLSKQALISHMTP